MPDRKDQLLETIRQTVGVQTAEFQSARAELEILNAQAYLENLQKTREVLAAMDSEISRFRAVVDRAAKDGERTSRALVCWTKVLALTSVCLVLANIALVYATFALRH